MGQRNGIVLTNARTYNERTGVLDAAGTGCRVSHMPDTTACEWEAGTGVLKNLAYLAHTSAMDNLPIAIIHGHPRAFLSPMLQGSEGQGDVASHVKILLLFRHINAHYSACIV